MGDAGTDGYKSWIRGEKQNAYWLLEELEKSRNNNLIKKGTLKLNIGNETTPNQVRDYVRGQIELWKLIPYYALHTCFPSKIHPDEFGNGSTIRFSNEPRNVVAYTKKLWQLNPQTNNEPIFVKLSLGEIVCENQGQAINKLRLATDSQILEEIIGEGVVIDPAKIIHTLIKESESKMKRIKPKDWYDDKYNLGIAQVANWRAKQREKYHIMKYISN